MEVQAYTLSQFNLSIQDCLKEVLPDTYWITAEINDMKETTSGHCYLELVEKDTEGVQIIAKISANIWANTFRLIVPYFKTMTGHPFAVGMKVMLMVSVEFHQLYGMSLNIKDINPTFTIGELAMQKHKIIEQLTDEGIIEMNKNIKRKQLLQRVAIISSESAAGYGDFINQVCNNQYRYVFYCTLFQATMQGEEAQESIINALDRIYQQENQYDVVVIIRGGGSQSDLNCFNSYSLAANIAQFPLPIITGIGHVKDQTIADLVANLSLKTPTAVAEFLIQEVMTIDSKLHQMQDRIKMAAKLKIEREKQKIERLQMKIFSTVKMSITNKKQKLDMLSERIKSICYRQLNEKETNLNFLHLRIEKAAKATIAYNKNKINLLETKLKALDPTETLKKGYTLTYSNKRLIRNPQEINQGDVLETLFYNGKVESVVKVGSFF
jgi:exodeoxyribonuclease VII large subunit